MEQEKHSKTYKTLYYSIIVLLILLIITGSTYAFFVFSRSSNTVNVTSVQSVSLSYVDNKENMIKDLVPSSKENVLKGIEKTEDKCVDIYGYSACSLYEFTVGNDSDVSQVININMVPVENTYSNLHFILYKDKISDLDDTSIPLIDSVKLDSDSMAVVTFNDLTETISAGDSVSYTLVFYIQNKEDEDQTKEDSGKKFRANINVNSITTGQYVNGSVQS